MAGEPGSRKLLPRFTFLIMLHLSCRNDKQSMNDNVDTDRPAWLLGSPSSSSASRYENFLIWLGWRTSNTIRRLHSSSIQSVCLAIRRPLRQYCRDRVGATIMTNLTRDKILGVALFPLPVWNHQPPAGTRPPLSLRVERPCKCGYNALSLARRHSVALFDRALFPKYLSWSDHWEGSATPTFIFVALARASSDEGSLQWCRMGQVIYFAFYIPYTNVARSMKIDTVFLRSTPYLF